jgi:hypothetical protein
MGLWAEWYAASVTARSLDTELRTQSGHPGRHAGERAGAGRGGASGGEGNGAPGARAARPPTTLPRRVRPPAAVISPLVRRRLDKRAGRPRSQGRR